MRNKFTQNVSVKCSYSFRLFLSSNMHVHCTMNSEEKKKNVLETQQTLKDGKQVKKEKHKTVKNRKNLIYFF